MIRLEATRIVDVAPQKVVELCTDIEHYQAIDPKITEIRVIRVGRDIRQVELRQKIGWLPLPRQKIRITSSRWRSIDYQQYGGWLARVAMRYRARMTIEATDDGTVVTHHYAVGFRGPFGWPTERLVRPALARALEDEMDRLAETFNDTVIELRPPS